MGWICLIKVPFQHFSAQKSRARLMNRQPWSYSFWEKLSKFNIRSEMRNAAQSNATWLPLLLDGILFSANWASELCVCSYKTFSVNEVKFFSFHAFNGSQRCSIYSIQDRCASSLQTIPLGRLPPLSFCASCTCWSRQKLPQISAKSKIRGAAKRPSHRQFKGCWSLVSYRRQSQATPGELKEK